jgi:NitT/TauT family transport system substrate-binding protein
MHNSKACIVALDRLPLARSATLQRIEQMTRLVRTLPKLAAALTLVAGALAGPTSVQAQDLAKVRLAVNASSSTVPILMGIKQGIFKAHGLDVSYQVIPNITLIPAGLGKTWEFGFSVGPITINAANSGIPVVAAIGLDQAAKDPGNKTITKPEIKSVADLKGKTIGAPTLTGNINLATKAWLRASGVDPASVRFVQVPTPNMIDQLGAGLIDAAELIAPFDTQALAKGFNNVGDPIPVALGVPVMMTWWAANKDWIAQNQDTLNKFKSALKEAYAWVATHQDESRADLAALTGMSPELAKDISLTGYNTEISADDMVRWGKLMENEGGFKPSIDYRTLVP